MSEHESESTTLPAVREPDMVRLAEELVASATDRGLALTGEGGLLTELTRKVLGVGVGGRDVASPGL